VTGVLYIDAASVEATTGRMLITFKSGGDAFRFHPPPNVALRFRETIMKEGWQVLCAPDAELVQFPSAKAKKRRKRQEVGHGKS
jgi:hypothetical protein